MLLSPPHNAFAQPQKAIIAEPGVASIRYVVPSGTDAGNDCGNSAAPCATVQHAVDMAAPGDEVHVAAGTYTDVQARDGITQMVYISKTATIRGGYTTTNWATFDPSANPTTLDARDQGRVFYITGTPDVRLEGLNITGGNARGLGGVFGGDGGGGLYTANSDNLVVSGCQIYSNTAAYYGGGGDVYGGDAILVNNVITGNSAPLYGGGGLYLDTAVLVSATNNRILSNTAFLGAGVWWGIINGRGSFSGNTLAGNVAADRGGGLMLISTNTPSLTLSGNTIARNRAGNDGGGAWLGTGISTVTANLFISNAAAGSGGGIFLYYSADTLANNVFISNTSDYDFGGGIGLQQSPARLIGNQLSHNQAGVGGGVGGWDSPASAQLIDNIITDNVAYSGGGIGLYAMTATLKGNLIAGNAGSIRGGGIDAVESSTELDGNLIASNSSSDGSGIYLWHSSRNVLTNNVVISHSGLGLIVDRSDARLLHNTIAHNLAGILVSTTSGMPGIVTMTNTLLANDGAALNVTSGSTATLDGVLWFGNLLDVSGSGAVTIAQAVTGNPSFALDGYHLLTDSAAIDTGVDSHITIDIDGDALPQGRGF